MERTYSAFRALVKEDLRKSLAVWVKTEEALEDYVSKCESEIKGAYNHYLNPRENDDREDGVRFTIGASTIAYDLYMSY